MTLFTWAVITLIGLVCRLPIVFAPVTILQSEPPQGEQRFVVDLGEGACSKLDGCAQYWIGTLCAPVPEMLRPHLSIEDGLVVEQVAEGTPAEKAGIQPFDVLMAINGTRLLSCDQLVDAIQDAREQPVRLTVLRRRNELEITLVPEQRCMPQMSSYVVVTDDSANGLEFEQLEKLRAWIEQKQSGDGPPAALRVVVVGPAVSVHNNPAEEAEFDSTDSELRIAGDELQESGSPRVVALQILEPMIQQLRSSQVQIDQLLGHLELRHEQLESQLQLAERQQDNGESARLNMQRLGLLQKIDRWSNMRQRIAKHLTQIGWSEHGQIER